MAWTFIAIAVSYIFEFGIKLLGKTRLKYISFSKHKFIKSTDYKFIEIENITKCKNPRCITSVEQEIVHKFRLTDRNKKLYRCVYCDTAFEQN